MFPKGEADLVHHLMAKALLEVGALPVWFSLPPPAGPLFLASVCFARKTKPKTRLAFNSHSKVVFRVFAPHLFWCPAFNSSRNLVG